MVQLSVNRRKLPRADYRKVNYASLMMDEVLEALQHVIVTEIDKERSNGKGEYNKYLMFYRFDEEAFSRANSLEPAFKPSPRMPGYRQPDYSINFE